MGLFMSSILVFLFIFLGQYNTYALQDVTTDLFGGKNNGTVAAFGDFNSDKQTDIFIIREQLEVLIFLADSKAPYFKPQMLITKDVLPRDTIITSVVPGDYDGDSQMDVLLTLSTQTSPVTTVVVFWGNNMTLDMGGFLKLNKTFTDQPLVMDFNGDMIPDLFGVTEQKSSEVCYLTKRMPVWVKALNSSVSLRVPHSNAFIDLDRDFNADLFLTAENSKFETWLNKDGKFTREDVMPTNPPEAAVIGQSAFVDFDGDGSQDHLLPVCLDPACKQSRVFLAKSSTKEKEWFQVPLDFQQKETQWGFVPGNLEQPLALHLGDYNLDGFPDALVILRNTSGSGQQAFLLENVPCNNASCQSVGRMFHIHWDQSDLGAIQNAVMATFFDIYEDGILDMLVLSKAEAKKDLIIHALKNNFEADAYFVKVMVLSGLCSNDCPDDVKPLGVNQPGPFVSYTTVDSNGYQKNASGRRLLCLKVFLHIYITLIHGSTSYCNNDSCPLVGLSTTGLVFWEVFKKVDKEKKSVLISFSCFVFFLCMRK
ncbi:T-cell immunomodulatory protein isoform X2 [Betta splendens]|uniref:T-cell immunomodulatory protein isoform X2 n=1 Tax=Betta splendens TaxID=158456 RepID=A0A6P7M094_BETSP|nr:T-cell immunomodulatory protein isoform X2 [Betta splendens]